MSNAILPTGYVWLAEAVAIAAETRFPEAWAAAQMTEEQSEMLREYRSLRKQYEEQQQRADRAEPMSLADLDFAKWVGRFSVQEQQTEPLQEPERSEEIEIFEEKERLWQTVFDAAWAHLRQALLDGKVSATCMMHLEPNAAIDAEHWGKDSNYKAHWATSIFLGLSPSNNKPRSGKAFLSRSALLAWLGSENGSEPIAQDAATDPRLETIHEASTEEDATRLQNCIEDLQRKSVLWASEQAPRMKYSERIKYLMTKRGLTKRDAELVNRKANLSPGFRGVTGRPPADKD